MGLKRALPPLVFGLLAVGYMAIAGGFGDETSAEAPMLYGEVMLGLAVLMGALGFAPARSRAAVPEADGGLLPSVEIYVVIAGFIALIFLVGFYAAIAAFLFLFLRFRSRVPLVQALLFAVAACGFTWLVFGYFLHLVVFAGYFPHLF